MLRMRIQLCTLKIYERVMTKHFTSFENKQSDISTKIECIISHTYKEAHRHENKCHRTHREQQLTYIFSRSRPRHALHTLYESMCEMIHPRIACHPTRMRPNTDGPAANFSSSDATEGKFS